MWEEAVGGRGRGQGCEAGRLERREVGEGVRGGMEGVLEKGRSRGDTGGGGGHGEGYRGCGGGL